MTQMVMAICGEPFEQGYHIRRFVYLGAAMDNEKPRDARYINKLLDRLGVRNEGEDVYVCWTVGEEPPKNFIRLFDVYIYIENVGKPNAVYKADYHAYPRCPSAVIDDGMGIYKAIRKEGIRPSVKRQQKINKMRSQQGVAFRSKTASEAVGENVVEPKKSVFEVGKMYRYPKKDSLGHIEMGMVKVKGVMSVKKKVVVDIANGRKNVVLDVREGDGCETVYLRKEGVVISSLGLINGDGV